jgi:hypothetical protein
MTRAAMLASLRAILIALSDWTATGHAPTAVNEISDDIGSALRRLETLGEDAA